MTQEERTNKTIDWVRKHPEEIPVLEELSCKLYYIKDYEYITKNDNQRNNKFLL